MDEGQLEAQRRDGDFRWEPEDGPTIKYVELFGPASDQDLFYEFAADILHEDEYGDVLGTMGRLSGLAAWDVTNGFEDMIWEAADAIDEEVAEHGAYTQALLEWLLGGGEDQLRNVILLNRLHLRPEYRGHRLLGQITDSLLEILPLEPDETLVTTWPEPEDPNGGFSDQWPGHDEALTRMRAAHEAVGFQRWRDTPVWWRVGNTSTQD